MLIISALPVHVSKLGTSSLQSAIVGLSVSGAQWQDRERGEVLGGWGGLESSLLY